MTGGARPATEQEAQFIRDLGGTFLTGSGQGLQVETMVTVATNYLFQLAWSDAGESGIQAMRDILNALEKGITPTEKPN